MDAAAEAIRGAIDVLDESIAWDTRTIERSEATLQSAKASLLESRKRRHNLEQALAKLAV